MSEEHACLVRTRSDSETSSKIGGFGTMTYTESRAGEGAGEPTNTGTVTNLPQDTSLNNLDSNENGELIDYSEVSVLAQFHEDALKQAGCGLAQLRILLATGLAMSGAALEVSVIPFILPSAELELCIQSHEKSWLGMISLLGVCLGSVGWGNLSDRLGRRRTLVSCLCVNAVFSTIAAFMPTYGTFMMARFCSAIGSGGIVPTVFSYMAEFCPRAHRGFALAPLLLFAALGGLYATGVAKAIVPRTGTETLIENKEHFSAWHRYLLLCTLPILASLVSLIWTQESPRYLLETSREVDALMVYQSIHSSNQIRMCGKRKGNMNVNSNGSDYRLGELELPGKRRPPALHHVRHSVKMFWQAFFQLFSHNFIQTTVTLGGTLFFAMFVQYSISAYAPATVLQMENAEFEASKRIVTNEEYTNGYYNETFQNVEYVNSSFVNCVFRDIFMSHVTFRNCSFLNSSFFNIKTSYTSFRGSLFVNSSIIDTDIESPRDFDEWCVLNSTIIRGMSAGCPRHADLTSNLDGAVAEQTYVWCAHAVAAPLALVPSKMRPLSILLLMCCVCTPAIYFVVSETALYILEAVFRFLLSLVFFGATVSIVESYPANLRCTAHGFIMSLVYAGAMSATSIYSSFSSHGYIVATLVTAVLTVFATMFSLKAQDSSSYLL